MLYYKKLFLNSKSAAYKQERLQIKSGLWWRAYCTESRLFKIMDEKKNLTHGWLHIDIAFAFWLLTVSTTDCSFFMYSNWRPKEVLKIKIFHVATLSFGTCWKKKYQKCNFVRKWSSIYFVMDNLHTGQLSHHFFFWQATILRRTQITPWGWIFGPWFFII